MTARVKISQNIDILAKVLIYMYMYYNDVHVQCSTLKSQTLSNLCRFRGQIELTTFDW